MQNSLYGLNLYWNDHVEICEWISNVFVNISKYFRTKFPCYPKLEPNVATATKHEGRALSVQLGWCSCGLHGIDLVACVGSSREKKEVQYMLVNVSKYVDFKIVIWCGTCSNVTWFNVVLIVTNMFNCCVPGLYTSR